MESKPTTTSGQGLQQLQRTLTVATRGRGLHEITREVGTIVSGSGVHTGLCVVFCTHTSCSLLIQENADPSAARDLEAWLDRLAPDGDPRYTHVAEGPDDMPSHLKAAITRTQESIPIADRRLVLGTWQGIYVVEHRRAPHRRRIVVHVSGVG